MKSFFFFFFKAAFLKIPEPGKLSEMRAVVFLLCSEMARKSKFPKILRSDR